MTAIREAEQIARDQLGPTFCATLYCGYWLITDSRLRGRPDFPRAGTVNFAGPNRRSLDKAIADAKAVLDRIGLSYGATKVVPPLPPKRGGGAPYFNQDETDPRFSRCPRCGERVGPEEAKDFESFDVVDCGSADVTVYCDVFLSALANRAECGLVFRVADDNNLLMLRMGKSGAGGTGMVLYKRVAGAFTIISNNPSGLIFNNNQTYRVAAALSGASVVVTIDGTVHMNVTLSAGDQTTFGANTLHGLRVSHALTEDDTGSSFANFVVVSALGSYGLVLA